MKSILSSLVCVLILSNAFAQNARIELVATTETAPWQIQKVGISKKIINNPDVVLLLHSELQTIEGFGACFNELGWTSLSELPKRDKNRILKELFQPNFGANFTICRMPVGANDFSRDWYSYNETAEDFGMTKFSISNDLETLVPFIKNALRYNPGLKIWASPWSPPSWMKWNKHYACRLSEPELDAKFRNHLDSLKQGKEGTNMFIQDEKYLRAYALYFSKFIDAYNNQGIDIGMVMPQNEFNSCQIFPSCTWTASALTEFVGQYLGPTMKRKEVAIMFGTMERANEALVDTALLDKQAGQFIKGVGFQWAGKNAINGIHKRYPALQLYQSEQECGDGKNDWAYCNYAWSLMKHYFESGASAYMYWNISLEKGGYSRWGWQQNSLITVDSKNKSFQFNHEYYLMKHFSHFIKPGAKMIETTGGFKNLLAFINPDKSIVLVAQNETDKPVEIAVKVESSFVSVRLKPSSFNSIIINM